MCACASSSLRVRMSVRVPQTVQLSSSLGASIVVQVDGEVWRGMAEVEKKRTACRNRAEGKRVRCMLVGWLTGAAAMVRSSAKTGGVRANNSFAAQKMKATRFETKGLPARKTGAAGERRTSSRTKELSWMKDLEVGELTGHQPCARPGKKKERESREGA